MDNLKCFDIDVGNGGLCKAALDCLESVLDASGIFIKPVLQSIMQEKIVGICTEVSTSWNSVPLYENYECRIAIFKVLAAMVHNPHHLCPPPVQYATHLLDRALRFDDNFEVKKKCSELYKVMETLVHPRREVLYFNIGEKRAKDAIVDKNKHPLNEYLKVGNVVFRENREDDEMQTDDGDGEEEQTENQVKPIEEKSVVQPANEVIDVDKEDIMEKDKNQEVPESCQIIIEDSQDVETFRVDDSQENKSDDDVEIIEPPRKRDEKDDKYDDVQVVENQEPTTKKIKLSEDNEEVEAKVQDLMSSFVDELNDDDEIL